MDDPRLAHYPFVSGRPELHVMGGEGSHLITADGRRILDGGGGAVVVNIGHGRPEPARAAARSLSEVGFVLPPWATEGRLALTERLRTRWLPAGIERCLLVSGGSESVDSAVRVARTHHVARGRSQRWKVLGRSVSYHGATLATLSIGNHDRRRRGLEPLLTDLPKIDPTDIEQVAAVIEAEDPDTIAAIVVEPVSGSAGGALVPPDDYLPGLRRLCTEHEILLVADEVMTGFGRTGTRFAVDHQAVSPDILIGGKGLGGGYVPIGGVYAGPAVLDPIAEAGMEVMFFTFSAADVSCRVADEVLRILDEERLVDRAAEAGTRLAGLLTDAFDRHPNVVDVRGRGLLQGIELVADRADGSTFAGRLTPLVVAEALRRDCWIYPAGSGAVHDALLFAPPFVITDAELERLVTVAAESIDAAVATLRRA